MPKVLSVSLRPRSLSALYGQDSTVKAIRGHVKTRPPAAWLFTGPSGSGKTTIARILAVSFQCAHMKLWGDPCDDCWRRISEFSIHEVDATDVSGVDEIREVVRLSRFKPMNPDGKRVIVVDEAHGLSKSSNSVLLKPTEDAPASTVWIFCTTDPSKMLPTLRRRCTTYALRSLGISDAEAFVLKQAKASGITRPLKNFIEQCHVMQVSAPALLLQALEKFSAGASEVEAVSGADGSKVDSFRICKAVTSGDWKTIREQLKDATGDEVRWIRASVAGWLKGCLARETDSVRAEKAAVSLLELSAMPYDEGMLIHWLWGSMHKICKRYRS